MSQDKKIDISQDLAAAVGSSSMETEQARVDADPNSVTPVDVSTKLYLRLLRLLRISKMTAAEIVEIALRVTATAIENALLLRTDGRVSPDLIEAEIGKEVKRKHTSLLGLPEDDETDEQMIIRMRQSKQIPADYATCIDEDLEDEEEERQMGTKLVSTLQTILSPPKEPSVTVPEALRAAEERVSQREMALPLPVGAVHRMIGNFMQKYGLKKHESVKGVPPVTYCRYCSALVDLKERAKGNFCCEDARRLKDICKEWKERVLSVSGAPGKTDYVEEEDERKLGPKLVTTLKSILSIPKDPTFAIPEALQAAQERMSGAEMAMPLPVEAVHKMIGTFMQKYGLKEHIIAKGAEPVLHCRYCSAQVNLKEQEKGIFCCEHAKRLKDICQEWKRRVLTVPGAAVKTDDVEYEEERKLGPKLVTTLKTILSVPKDPASAVREALRAAEERVSGAEKAIPLPVEAVHKMIGTFMQKYGLKKHITAKGAEPVLNCRYCSAVVNLKEQEKGIFCCEDARRLKDICQEWKRRVSTISGTAGITKAQSVTTKITQLRGEIREAVTQELKGQKEDQALKPGTAQAAEEKDASSAREREEEWMKAEKVADEEGRAKKTTEKQLEKDELVARREDSKITAKARQEESETQKRKQQQKQMQEAEDKIAGGSKREDLKVASKTLRAGATDDQVLEKRGQKGDAKETGYDESKGVKRKGEVPRDIAGYDQTEDEIYRSKDAKGKVAAGKDQRSKTGQARDGKDVSDRYLESDADQPSREDRMTQKLKDQKADQTLKPGTAQATSVKEKEQERMKLESKKAAGKDVEDRQISRGKEQRGAAQSELDKEYYGTEDREKAKKAKQLGRHDEIAGKEKRKADSHLEQMVSSERVLGVHEPRDDKTGGKLQRGQREQADHARRQKDMEEQEGKKAKASRGKFVTISESQDKETHLKQSLKKEMKDSREERRDAEGSQKSKKTNIKPSKFEDTEEVSTFDDERTNKEKSSKRGAAAKETVGKKQSRPAKELLYTEEDKMLNDQSLSEQGRKRKPSSVGGRPSKHGPSGRDAFEEPTVSRSDRESSQSDSSHRISKSRGHAEHLKKAQSRRKTSHLPHEVGDDDSSQKLTREESKMAPRTLKDRTESTYHGSHHAASSMRDSTSSRAKGFSVSMAKGSRLHTASRTISSLHSKSKSTSCKSDGKPPRRAIAAHPSILYRLSEQEFIDLGWTILPCKTNPHRLVTYQATGAKIPCFWVCRKEDTTVEGNMEKMLYNNGKTFAVFYSNGNVKIFYPNGKQAIIIKRDEKGCLVTIMSPGGKNEKGTYMHPVTVGTFDSLGHGVIYNDYGGVRLSYNQEGGTYYETPHGRAIKWRWPISFAINFIKAHFSELCENNSRNAETLLHIRDLLAAKDKRDNKDKKEPRKETSPSKETPGGSPALKESSNEIKRIGSFGSPKKSPYKEQSPEKKESNYATVKESNRSKRRLQQEDTPSFTPLFMPPAIAACKMGEVQARAERKRQSLLNKAMNVAASCTPMSIIVLKINSFLGFRLLDQTAISIQFTAQDRFVRLELGVQIDPMVEAQVQMVDPNLITSCVPAQLLCLQKKSH